VLKLFTSQREGNSSFFLSSKLLFQRQFSFFKFHIRLQFTQESWNVIHVELIHISISKHDLLCTFYFNLGPSWSWSYGSWNYNCLCNQCLSPPTLWVWIPLRWGVLDTTLYNLKLRTFSSNLIHNQMISCVMFFFIYNIWKSGFK
jgi:hypothetical protein